MPQSSSIIFIIGAALFVVQLAFDNLFCTVKYVLIDSQNYGFDTFHSEGAERITLAQLDGHLNLHRFCICP
jgi:hypothetical protein